MKLLRFSALTISLIAMAAQAQDAATSADQAVENDASQADSFRWSDYPIEDSLLTAQARTVYAILRVRDAAEHGTPLEIDTVEVTVAEASDDSSNIGNCRMMARPGSRIMAERCIYESPGEAALNEFQYEMEYRRMQDLADIRFLDFAEYDLENRKQAYQNR